MTTERAAVVVLGPGEGRAYAMGPLSAAFKADGAEAAHRYSISEWWLVESPSGSSRELSRSHA